MNSGEAMVLGGGLAIKLVRCMWLVGLWPLWVLQWVLSLLCGSSANSGSSAGSPLTPPAKLSTRGSLGVFILVAAAIVSVGDWIKWVIFGLPAMLLDPRGGEEQPPEDVASWQTPPSSPPPFEQMRGADSGQPASSEGASYGGGGREQLTLSQRVSQMSRNLGSTVSALRRFGGAGLVTSRPVPSRLSHKASDQPDFRLGVDRSFRAYNLFEEIKRDYEQTQETLAASGDNREVTMRALHHRSALKVLELARQNGGLYTKAAQFVASLQGGAGDKGIPKEYVEVLRVLTDAAPHRPMSEMNSVLMSDFGGKDAGQLFASFDELPIAAASLAQVHRATLLDGREVAVKIMYPSLKKEMASDFNMFRRVGSQIQPGGYDLGWMVEDFEEAIKCELDLIKEARNSEFTGRIFEGRRDVIVPKIVWPLTSENVLTMEYVPGLLRVSEPEVLVSNDMSLEEAGALISDRLAEMALCEGHVHGDPHAGNIYLCARRSGMLGGVRPCLVLLDHGLYHTIKDGLRTDLCRLFNACISRNRLEIARLSESIAGPMHRFFPLLLSPWFILGTSLSWEDLDAARNNRLPPSITSKDVGSAFEALHNSGGAVLGVLHSFGYTRGLLNMLSFSERSRLKSMSSHAHLGLLPKGMRQRALRDGLHTLPLHERCKIWRGWLQVDVSAVMLRVLTITMSPEIDGSKSFGWCLVLADFVLEVGRLSVLKLMARMSGMTAEQACDDAAEVPNTTDWEGRETACGGAGIGGGGDSGCDSRDSAGARGPGGADASSGQHGGQAEGGRWQGAMAKVRRAVESAEETDRDAPPGNRSWARKGVLGLAKRVLHSADGGAQAAAADSQGADAGPAAAGALQVPSWQRRIRRANASPSKPPRSGVPWI